MSGQRTSSYPPYTSRLVSLDYPFVTNILYCYHHNICFRQKVGKSSLTFFIIYRFRKRDYFGDFLLVRRGLRRIGVNVSYLEKRANFSVHFLFSFYFFTHGGIRHWAMLPYSSWCIHTLWRTSLVTGFLLKLLEWHSNKQSKRKILKKGINSYV